MKRNKTMSEYNETMERPERRLVRQNNEFLPKGRIRHSGHYNPQVTCPKCFCEGHKRSQCEATDSQLDAHRYYFGVNNEKLWDGRRDTANLYRVSDYVPSGQPRPYGRDYNRAPRRGPRHNFEPRPRGYGGPGVRAAYRGNRGWSQVGMSQVRPYYNEGSRPRGRSVNKTFYPRGESYYRGQQVQQSSGRQYQSSSRGREATSDQPRHSRAESDSPQRRA